MKNYIKNIQEHHLQRQEMLKDFHLKSNETQAILNRFLGKKDKPINFNDLILSFDFNEWVLLNDKVKFRLINFSDSTAVFDTIMERNGEFGTHIHNDCIEKVEVLSGVLFDSMTSQLIRKGEVVFFDAGVKHTPISLEKCVLKVTFTKV